MVMDISAPPPPDEAQDRDGLGRATFAISRPARQTAPLIIASPHSGSDYSPAFLAASRLDARALRKSEDSFVDDLCAGAPGLGVPLITAGFPRAYCDANREAWELDPAMFEDALPDYVNTTSPRVAAGLGTIARVVASGEPIYRRKLMFADARSRIATCWQPYHDAMTALMNETKDKFGACLLLDIHSMPTPYGNDQRQGHGPDIVLGDAHGVACARSIVSLVEQALRAEGLVVKRNDPYAGGYITRHYGRPRERMHVLQIEIAKPLYMNEREITRTAGFAPLQAALGRMIATVAQSAATLV
jgi:N-formylglutamate amidohydrolase